MFAKSSDLRRYLHTTDGKQAWALVTGASGGIGSNLAKELARTGFNVVLHGRSAAKLKQIESELTQAYPQRSFRILVLDAAQSFSPAHETNHKELLAQIEDINLTVVINNAGGSTERTTDSFDALSAERLRTDACVNAVFPTLLLRQLIPQLRRNAPGLIINIGSLADLGVTKVGSYAASKAYLMKLTEVLCREMRMEKADIEVLGIRVGNVWGTQQTVATTQGVFAPHAATMAKAVLARVGCGRMVIVGHWAHALQFEALQLLPKVFLEYLLSSEVKKWDMGTKKFT